MQSVFKQMRPALEKLVDPKIAKSKIAILVDIPSHSIHILERGKIVESYEVAVAEPPFRTTLGLYKIASKEKNPSWNLTQSEVAEAKAEGWWEGKRSYPPGPDNPMGPRAMRLARSDGKSTNYFIHGTDSSHEDYSTRGCVSLWRNDKNIEHIFDLVPLGTPVQISYESVYVSADKSELYIFDDMYKKGKTTAARVHGKLKAAGVKATPKIDADIKEALSGKYEMFTVRLE